MWWVIIIALVCLFIYKLANASNMVAKQVKKAGGMRIKYHTLLDFILAGHREAKVFEETRTYISAGVSNYGGTTIFHIQQSSKGQCLIHYEVKNNPAIRDFQLRWTFSDDLSQEIMWVKINTDIRNKMLS